MADDDLVYLLKRAAEQRAKAAESRFAAVKAIHEDLALGYCQVARARDQHDREATSDDPDA